MGAAFYSIQLSGIGCTCGVQQHVHVRLHVHDIVQYSTVVHVLVWQCGMQPVGSCITMWYTAPVLLVAAPPSGRGAWDEGH